MRFARLLSLLLVLFPVTPMAQELRPLAVQTSDGPKVFQVELADNARTRARGLMHRKRMALDHGMLFDFKKELKVGFWMKDTLIPLDMIFARTDGQIVKVHHRAKALDRTHVPSGGPVRWVLEINGGLAKHLGIRVGDRLMVDDWR